MGKKNKKTSKLSMRAWPDDDKLVARDMLLSPLQQVIDHGYRAIERERLPVFQFNYKGYNIGEADAEIGPNPQERLSENWLSNESKFGRSLLTNVLIIAFQLGVEQGRRQEKPNLKNSQLNLDIMKRQKRRIQILEEKIKELDPAYLLQNEIVPTSIETPLCIENEDIEE